MSCSHSVIILAKGSFHRADHNYVRTYKCTRATTSAIAYCSSVCACTCVCVCVCVCVFVTIRFLSSLLQVISCAVPAPPPAGVPTQSPPKETASATSRQPSAGERLDSGKPTHIAFGKKVEIPEHVLKSKQVRVHLCALTIAVEDQRLVVSYTGYNMYCMGMYCEYVRTYIRMYQHNNNLVTPVAHACTTHCCCTLY